jgi:uncharacterized ferritin-like protein (DUF455 family)
MKISQIVHEILKGKNLSQKLVSLEEIEYDQFSAFEIQRPARSRKIDFSSEQKKFPRSLKEVESRAYALHSFANHELLAIEIMAYCLNQFSNNFPFQKDALPFKKAIISAIKDEQKHLSLYIGRINELGFEFGDFPLNDFFWSYALKIKTPEQYFSMMSLTFEAANLDFAHYYKNVFNSIGDKKSAAIMNEVFIDEIKHVRIGGNFLSRWKRNKSLWDYYVENLILPLSADRSKGIRFNPLWRSKAGLDEEFVKSLVDYQSGFAITKRKCTT